MVVRAVVAEHSQLLRLCQRRSAIDPPRRPRPTYVCRLWQAKPHQFWRGTGYEIAFAKIPRIALNQILCPAVCSNQVRTWAAAAVRGGIPYAIRNLRTVRLSKGQTGIEETKLRSPCRRWNLACSWGV